MWYKSWVRTFDVWYSYAAVCIRACLFKCLKWLRRLFRRLKSAISLSDFYNYMACVLHYWVHCRSIGIDFKLACHLFSGNLSTGYCACWNYNTEMEVSSFWRRPVKPVTNVWSFDVLCYWPEQSMCRWFETRSPLNNWFFFSNCNLLFNIIPYERNTVKCCFIVLSDIRIIDFISFISSKHIEPGWLISHSLFNMRSCNIQQK